MYDIQQENNISSTHICYQKHINILKIRFFQKKKKIITIAIVIINLLLLKYVDILRYQ